jgi:putative membrane protein
VTEGPVQRDPGLQPERTALAWQRSALALAAATIVVGRLTFSAVGLVALLVVALGVVHAAVIFATAQRHYRLRTGEPHLSTWPTGVHAALLSAQVAALGVLEILTVLRS